MIKRKFKDVLWESDKDFKVIDLFFYQRYLRCDKCEELYSKKSVFPKEIDFAQKGSCYTNRLSDKLAEGTFRYSYQKVCDYYGVPASTASVGAIMRRYIQYKESLLDPIKSPKTLCVIEIIFYGEVYPAFLAIWNNEIFCLDILENTDEETYVSFFRTLDADGVETVCIEPEENLLSAVATCFPMASVVMTGECVTRYARNAMVDVIRTDGKPFPVKYKNDILTRNKKHLPDDRTRRQIRTGMKSRPRLKVAYDHHQKLLELLEANWSHEQLTAWASGESLQAVSKFSSRDYTKYQFDRQAYAKNRLVLAVVQKHVENNPGITLKELTDAFTRNDLSGFFSPLKEAQEIFERTSHRRHFVDEPITLFDAQIAVSNQWGSGNIDRFIALVAGLGYSIKSLNQTDAIRSQVRVLLCEAKERGDEVLNEPKSGLGSRVTIRYYLQEA